MFEQETFWGKSFGWQTFGQYALDVWVTHHLRIHRWLTGRVWWYSGSICSRWHFALYHFQSIAWKLQIFHTPHAFGVPIVDDSLGISVRSSASENYTVSQKTSHLWLAITLTHINRFWYFFGRNVTDKVGNSKINHISLMTIHLWILNQILSKYIAY